MRGTSYLRRIADLPEDASPSAVTAQLDDFLAPGTEVGVADLDEPGAPVDPERSAAPPLGAVLRRVLAAGEPALVSGDGPRAYRSRALDGWLGSRELYLAPVRVRRQIRAVVWAMATAIEPETRDLVDATALVIGIRMAQAHGPAPAGAEAPRGDQVAGDHEAGGGPGAPAPEHEPSSLADLATASEPPWRTAGSVDASQLEPPLVALLVAHDGHDGRRPADSELLAAISAALRSRVVRSVIGARPGEALVLASRHRIGAATGLAARIVEQCRERSFAAVCFISSDGSVAELPRLIDEVERLAALGRVLSIGRPVVDAASIGAYAILLEVASPQRLGSWAQSLLGPLIAYDADHNASMVATLEAYLEEWGHLVRCAPRIFVHPNTLKYRLRRIREILGVDPRDPLVRRDLLLACYAWRTARALEGTPA